MRYLNEAHIQSMGIDWKPLVDSIAHVITLMGTGDYTQPLKPYLRFKNQRNRIIAMPAYVGAPFGIAGIKWIASFPGNILRHIPRAHSVTILNDEATGKPVSVINTALISGIRTAAVSGYVTGKYLEAVQQAGKTYNVGIIGLGPIGQLHLQMMTSLLGHSMGYIYLYDIRSVDEAFLQALPYRDKIIVAKDWMQVFNAADILVTCTVANERYINAPPKKGALYLNVSLRDFGLDFIQQADLIIVDDWLEVCREDTDIERAHKSLGLVKEQVKELIAFNEGNILKDAKDASIMFNPMGMGVFDIAIAKYYHDLACKIDAGVELAD
jgi:N-[(2S)-2-amino-2-carboxyethyl]-L-glutamate dehydrogenase